MKTLCVRETRLIRESKEKEGGNPMNASPLSLLEAKARLDVVALWRLFNLPGEPRRSCRCPFHQDRNASFSVYPSRGGALRWKCFGGCGEGGSVELIALVLDVDEKTACRRLLDLAGSNVMDVDIRPRQRPAARSAPAKKLVLPSELRQGMRDDLRAIANQRGLSLSGVELASERGLLRFAKWRGHAAWFVIDSGAINAQARRLDGQRWAQIGGAKSWTLPGSQAAWPIGIRDAESASFVVIVEGGPDMLAAHHFVAAEEREQDVAVVAMLGGANYIPEAALHHLVNKRIRIFPHDDAVGHAAAIRWTEQLECIGAQVDAFAFSGLCRSDGASVKDLNDLALIDVSSFEAEYQNLSEVLPR